ncbi:MAG TPA: hypothetical protein DEB10_07260 [Ruminococcaceae bacterium]|nr:hypothetical protein [Oscillospiraceae bacterium]
MNIHRHPFVCKCAGKRIFDLEGIMNIKQEETTQQIGKAVFVIISHYGKQSPIELIKNLLERESLKYTVRTNDKAS